MDAKTTDQVTAQPTAPWLEFLKSLEPIGDIAQLVSDPHDEQRVMEVYQYALLSLMQGYKLIAGSDPKTPFWDLFYVWPLGSHGASPDIKYHYTQIDEDGVYRIWGKRNSIHIMNFQVGTPTWGEGVSQGFTLTLDNFDVDSLNIAADGSFEVILSNEKPQNWHGDWWHLPKGKQAHSLWVRQIMNDWFKERDAEIHVERLDDVDVAQRPSADAVRQRLIDMARFADGATRNWAQHIRKMREKGLVNKLEYARLLDEGGYAAQAYWQGNYSLKPDEALIISTQVPESTRYWNVQITDELYLPLDYPARQTSVNGAQAWLPKNRVFHAVIANEDPGVPNWLDTGGYLSGSILGRWNKCSSEPIPEVIKVPLAEVRAHLPPETPIVLPVERAAQMRARRRAYLNRIEL